MKPYTPLTASSAQTLLPSLFVHDISIPTPGMRCHADSHEKTGCLRWTLLLTILAPPAVALDAHCGRSMIKGNRRLLFAGLS